MRRPWIALGLIAALICLPGCGGAKGPSEAETAPFAVAIEQYLKEKSFGMRIVGFESLDVTVSKATAVVRMSAKDIDYGVQPKWTFEFEKSDDGWGVTAHKY